MSGSRLTKLYLPKSSQRRRIRHHASWVRAAGLITICQFLHKFEEMSKPRQTLGFSLRALATAQKSGLSARGTSESLLL
jgi:hypothetical protein